MKTIDRESLAEFKEGIDKRLKDYTTSFFALHNDYAHVKDLLEFATTKYDGFHTYMGSLKSKLHKCEENYSNMKINYKKLNEKYTREKKEWSEKDHKQSLEISSLNTSHKNLEDEKQGLRLIIKTLLYKRNKYPNVEFASSVENLCRYHGYDLDYYETELQKLQSQVEMLTTERDKLADELFLYKFRDA